MLTTVRRMHSASPRSKVVILSMYDGPKLLKSLLMLGIKGYLLKSVTRHELVAAMRGARTDDDRVLLSVSSESLAKVHAAEPAVLSDRERDILELVASAMSNAQIASRLRLTEATVKRHLRNIFGKLDAVSRIDAVNKAIAASLGGENPSAIRIRPRLPDPHALRRRECASSQLRTRSATMLHAKLDSPPCADL